MRVVVYPARLEIGGSQITALDAAVAVRDLGHEVIVFGQPGSLVERIAAAGMEFVAAPRPGQRPCPRTMRALRRLVAERDIDLVHGYEWTTALEAYWGPRARMGVPAVASVMSMAVVPFVPHDMPLIVGTEQIAAHERARGRWDVTVVEPPVDIDHFAPDGSDPRAVRSAYGLDPDSFTVGCVMRLSDWRKVGGLLAAMDLVGERAASEPIQLLVGGDGPDRALVAARAEQANARAGRRVIALVGELRDPRPAYAASDICFGMGSAALQAMALERPLIVQGEQGFWELLTPDSAQRFLWTGWYGAGAGEKAGAAKLAGLLRELAGDADRRARLGAHARRLVEDRFSLQSAAKRQLEVYDRVFDTPVRPGRWLGPGAASVPGLAAYRVRSRADQVLRRDNADELVPVAAAADSQTSKTRS